MSPFLRLSLRFLSLGAIAVTGHPAGPAAIAARNCNAKALYFITNEPENAVTALQVGANGLLTGLSEMTPAGGAGASAVDGSTNQPAGPDALVSQSALTVAGNVRMPFRMESEWN
jgi:hypothetical protein